MTWTNFGEKSIAMPKTFEYLHDDISKLGLLSSNRMHSMAAGSFIGLDHGIMVWLGNWHRQCYQNQKLESMEALARLASTFYCACAEPINGFEMYAIDSDYCADS